MKKISIRIILVAMGCMLFSSLAFAGQKKEDGFKAFYKSFKIAVQADDHEKLTMLMTEDFEWAMDGVVPREQAIQNMSMLKCWDDLRSAIKANAKPWVDPDCQKGQCYASWSKKSVTGFIFIKSDESEWRWGKLRAD